MHGQDSDVLIVSAFGRGEWLAAELADKNLNVKLVDVSSSLGHWAPEDWEGPFGFFQEENLSSSQIERISEEDFYEPIDEGFALWLKDGPLDFKGPFSSFILEKKGLKDFFDKYLSASKSKNLEKFEAMPFEKYWMIHLAGQLASNKIAINNYEASELKKNITSKFSLLYSQGKPQRGRKDFFMVRR